MTVTVGVSLKMYFGHRQATEWFRTVAERVRAHAAVAAGDVELFVVPTYLQVLPAVAAFSGTPVRVGAQDVAAADAGAFTGEVSAAELAEVGVALAEVGHAERRALFAETDEITAAKAAAALRNGLTPVLCLGEDRRVHAEAAAEATVAQLRADLDGAPGGRVVLAYEPVWAIGAADPAPAHHIRTVAGALRAALDDLPGREGSSVVYGGSAGPGLLGSLGDDVDGLFLGRFAHDPDDLVAVLDEAAALARTRRAA
ncbi:triose-phosphate isomerase [Microbacterium betulae]|uniref:Triosephosphate isomerase n=1 Tax=Microbacterium betulae TaxID=2981139 RepID=A0AA97FMS5_9MICO|nr:triose-phosphate isomerase family protein [Microbacterium sp. AB]WOF24277.1 triose-phosphate isomerase [Microbacterium sp. AB]